MPVHLFLSVAARDSGTDFASEGVEGNHRNIPATWNYLPHIGIPSGSKYRAERVMSGIPSSYYRY